MLKSTELQRAGGFISACGSFDIVTTKDRPWATPRLRVSTTRDPEGLTRLQVLFGGSIKYYFVKDSMKTRKTWQIAGEDARQALKKLKKYLTKTRQAQAETLLTT